MADLMQKTKKELILMLQNKELAIQSLQNAQLVPWSDYESVLDQLEQLKIVNKALGGQNEELAAKKNQTALEQQRLQGELGKARCFNLGTLNTSFALMVNGRKILKILSVFLQKSFHSNRVFCRAPNRPEAR